MRLILAVAVASALVGGSAASEEPLGFDDEAAKLSYSIGYQVGSDFRRDGLELEVEPLVQGVLDAVSRSEPRMTPGEMRAALAKLRQRADAANGGEAVDSGTR